MLQAEHSLTDLQVAEEHINGNQSAQFTINKTLWIYNLVEMSLINEYHECQFLE